MSGTSTSASTSVSRGTTAISNRESDDLLKLTKKQALVRCDDVVRDFAACSAGRTVSVAWACRSHHRALQDCLKQFTSPEAFEKVKAAYLANGRVYPTPSSSSTPPPS